MTEKRFDWSKWVDPFVLTLFGVVALATLVPCQGKAATLFDYLADVAIVLLFFLHGAKLSREAILSGFMSWRLHIVILLVTFALFPIAGMVLIQLPFLDPTLSAGVLYLTLLPSTVQSSIAFTSIAKGNVAAAVCAATISNLIGIFLTPLLVAMLMQVEGVGARVSMDAVWKIGMQLLLPFIVGHMARPRIGDWVHRHKQLIGRVDRSSILLVVYTAFSAAIIDGLWSKCSLASLLVVCGISCGLLAGVLAMSWWIGHRLAFSRQDSIVLLFCGSKKSLASGVPIAGVLFSTSEMGLILLPVMIFHQIQLVVCAVIARRMGARIEQAVG
ncbi:MAG: bile acid:sodium symporter family protein [Pirellula sp.]